uniref:Uncharacterized protein n=1 Tax=Salvator merianae TaxID=96440 RepID=A0A8D0DRF6_SALMN
MAISAPLQVHFCAIVQLKSSAKAGRSLRLHLRSYAVTHSKPHLASFWCNARVELAFATTPAEIPKAIGNTKGSAKDLQRVQLTIREAQKNDLVATKVLAQFYVGEIIGKRGLIRYEA